MTKLRLTYIINKIDYGGAEIGAVRLLSGLDDAKFDITVITLKGTNSEVISNLPEYINIIEMNLNSTLLAKEPIDVYKCISNSDILVCSLFPSILLGSVIGKVVGVSQIYVWRHNTTSIGRARKILNRLSFRLSDGIFTDSKSTQQMVSRWGVDKSKITILPLSGINADLFKSPNNHDSTSRIRVGTIGRVVEEKGYPELLECSRLLPEYEFHIIGDGPLSDELDFSRNNITFHGEQPPEKVRKLLGTFDIYFQPSRTEGLCITAIEAMASELPVVASKVGGLTESVLDGQTGYLVEQGNISGYCKCLKKLAENPHLRSQFGTAGRQRVERHYSIDALATKFENIIE